jgi:hypothetical protein
VICVLIVNYRVVQACFCISVSNNELIVIVPPLSPSAVTTIRGFLRRNEFAARNLTSVRIGTATLYLRGRPDEVWAPPLPPSPYGQSWVRCHCFLVRCPAGAHLEHDYEPSAFFPDCHDFILPVRNIMLIPDGEKSGNPTTYGIFYVSHYNFI